MSQKLKNIQGPQNRLRSARSPETVTLCAGVTLTVYPIVWRYCGVELVQAQLYLDVVVFCAFIQKHFACLCCKRVCVFAFLCCLLN